MCDPVRAASAPSAPRGRQLLGQSRRHGSRLGALRSTRVDDATLEEAARAVVGPPLPDPSPPRPRRPAAGLGCASRTHYPAGRWASARWRLSAWRRTSATPLTEVPANLIRLRLGEFPTAIRSALPSLVTQPLADRSRVDAELGRQLPWSNRVGHPQTLGEQGSPHERCSSIKWGSSSRVGSGLRHPRTSRRALQPRGRSAGIPRLWGRHHQAAYGDLPVRNVMA